MLVTRFWTEWNGTANTHYPLLPLAPPPPPPPKNQGWNRAKAKMRQFPILGHSRPQCLRVWQKSSGSRVILDLGVKGVQIFHLFCPRLQSWNPHSPNSRMKPRKSQNAPISHHRGGEGGGGVQIFHLFCPSRCSKLKARGEDLGNKGLL